jgi:spoIIIJ-associated protein
MEWIETTGNTVEQAVETALDQLGVDESELEYEVLEEAQRSLLKRRPARIRARVRPVSREKPDTRRRRRRGEGPNGETSPSKPERAPAAARPEPGPRPEAAPKPAREERPAAERPPREPRPPRDRESEPTLDESELAEQAGVAQDFVNGLIQAMAVDAQVATTVQDGGVHVDITGERLGVLIGPRGATADAVHELTRTALQRHAGGQAARVVIDVAGYRERRKAALEDFAREVAEKAKSSGRDQVLEPMPPPDRKILHDVCADIEGVATASEGEEPRRRVVIRRA